MFEIVLIRAAISASLTAASCRANGYPLLGKTAPQVGAGGPPKGPARVRAPPPLPHACLTAGTLARHARAQWLLVARGVIGASAMTLSYEALVRLPLADSVRRRVVAALAAADRAASCPPMPPLPSCSPALPLPRCSPAADRHFLHQPRPHRPPLLADPRRAARLAHRRRLPRLAGGRGPGGAAALAGGRRGRARRLGARAPAGHGVWAGRGDAGGGSLHVHKDHRSARGRSHHRNVLPPGW